MPLTDQALLPLALYLVSPGCGLRLTAASAAADAPLSADGAARLSDIPGSGLASAVSALMAAGSRSPQS